MNSLPTHQCRQARLARDARFDGRFFVAVKSTGIFCRPICPAGIAAEVNEEYFASAVEAIAQGFRPCLRCRPETVPGSWAWQGVQTTLQRAVQLLSDDSSQDQSMTELSARLGISDRYLRLLFARHFGLSPKQYAQIQRLMFAKQLLHSSALPIADIALAAGFKSVRRFNAAFRDRLQLTPSAVRKGQPARVDNRLQLAVRSPLNWSHMLRFYKSRLAAGVEYVSADSYGRSFDLGNCRGWFVVNYEQSNCLTMEFSISDVSQLRSLIQRVRRLLDLDADTATIEAHLNRTAIRQLLQPGLRIPGVWSPWEAGVRAILGQQISVKAAIGLLNQLIAACADRMPGHDRLTSLFPAPQRVQHNQLDFLKIPERRKATLRDFAAYVVNHPDAPPSQWATLKGIGPWTMQYGLMRGQSAPDVLMATDLAVKKSLAKLPPDMHQQVSPWGSYATLHCWNAYDHLSQTC